MKLHFIITNLIIEQYSLVSVWTVQHPRHYNVFPFFFLFAIVEELPITHYVSYIRKRSCVYNKIWHSQDIRCPLVGRVSINSTKLCMIRRHNQSDCLSLLSFSNYIQYACIYMKYNRKANYLYFVVSMCHQRTQCTLWWSLGFQFMYVLPNIKQLSFISICNHLYIYISKCIPIYYTCFYTCHKQ